MAFTKVKERLLDPDNEKDFTYLTDWTTTMWKTIIPKARTGGNALTYNSCCNTFTKRGSTKNSGHPTEYQTSISDLMEREVIKDQQSLMDFFIKKAKVAKEDNKTFPFPTINKKHLSKEEVTLQTETLKDENEVLCKRLKQEITTIATLEDNREQLLLLNKTLVKKINELQKERDEAIEEIARLRKENEWMTSGLRNCKTCEQILAKAKPKEKSRAKTLR